jgi:hypothetical protein
MFSCRNFSSLPGLTRQSMRPHRTRGTSAWTTGSSPVVTIANSLGAQPAALCA